MKTGEEILKEIIKALEENMEDFQGGCILEDDDSILFDTSWMDRNKLCVLLERRFNKWI